MKNWSDRCSHLPSLTPGKVMPELSIISAFWKLNSRGNRKQQPCPSVFDYQQNPMVTNGGTGYERQTPGPLGLSFSLPSPSLLPLPFSSRSNSRSWMRTIYVMSFGESVSPSTGPTCTSCTMSMSRLLTTRMSPSSLSFPWTGTADGPQTAHCPLTAARPLVEWRGKRWLCG